MPGKRTVERREEIKNIIEELGLWNVPISHIAQKYSCSRVQIYKDIKTIIRGTPKESLEETSFGLQKAYKKSLRVVQQILADPLSERREKIEAARAIGLLIKHYTELLEDYGMKEKIADKIELKASDILQALKDGQTP